MNKNAVLIMSLGALATLLVFHLPVHTPEPSPPPSNGNGDNGEDPPTNGYLDPPPIWEV